MDEEEEKVLGEPDDAFAFALPDEDDLEDDLDLGDDAEETEQEEYI